MWSLVILFISIICASAICSMSEAAILSLPILRARILYEENRKGSKALLYIKENISITVASIVMLNNAINIIGSFFIGLRVTLLWGDGWLGLASAVMTFAIIIFGEIFPKAIGERYKTSLSLFLAKPLRFMVWILRPLVELILKMGGLFREKKYATPRVTEEEIKMMLKLGRDAGTVEMDEEVLCNRVFKLNDVRAYQVMRPISQIYALPADKTLNEEKNAIINSRFSRIAVYDKDPLDIIGVVEHRLLLRHIARDNGDAHIKEFMTKPIFVNHQTKADALLEKFLAYNQHLFIVQDDTGKTIGLITMEDVLEELFGEIYDEKDMKIKSSSSQAPAKQ